jgi:hypothetical protein
MMAAPPQKHSLSIPRRRALELLASSSNGATKELLVVAYGIDRDTIAGLVRAGLATARIETVNAGSKPIKVRRAIASRMPASSRLKGGRRRSSVRCPKGRNTWTWRALGSCRETFTGLTRPRPQIRRLSRSGPGPLTVRASLRVIPIWPLGVSGLPRRSRWAGLPAWPKVIRPRSPFITHHLVDVCIGVTDQHGNGVKKHSLAASGPLGCWTGSLMAGQGVTVPDVYLHA